jgi:hypothetical protein
MSQINPLGIDQSSGQLKPIASSDSVVGNIGSQIALLVVNNADYSAQANVATLGYSWTNPTRLAN